MTIKTNYKRNIKSNTKPSPPEVTISPVSLANEFQLVSPYFTNAETDTELKKYVDWLDNQVNPPKSYRDHPIESEETLNLFKKAFEKTIGLSLGAYLRIKRAYNILNNTSNKINNTSICEFSYLQTPIGMMLAIFYQDKLCVLEFLERQMLETELNQVIKDKQCHFQFKNLTSTSSLKTDKTEHHFVRSQDKIFSPIVKERTVGEELQIQLDDYFAGKRKIFDIPLDTVGTDFQREVWQTLQSIDYGTTISYQDEAEQMGKPTAMRAVANANGKNKISIIIPCHRVIRKNGELGGYGGGLWRKRYLLALENAVA